MFCSKKSFASSLFSQVLSSSKFYSRRNTLQFSKVGGGGEKEEKEEEWVEREEEKAEEEAEEKCMIWPDME